MLDRWSDTASQPATLRIGRIELQRPSDEAIARLGGFDRVTYIPLAACLKAAQPTTAREQLAVVREILRAAIIEDFPDKHIGIRGTTCSIAGHIEAKPANELVRRPIIIKGIAEVLADGTEYNASRLQHLGRVERGRLALGNIVQRISLGDIPDASTYCISNAQSLRASLAETGDRNCIFPVVLIYDLNALELGQEATQVVQYEPYMRVDQDPSTAILHAYILDAMPLLIP